MTVTSMPCLEQSLSYNDVHAYILVDIFVR
jgi:hypothetical protein